MTASHNPSNRPGEPRASTAEDPRSREPTAAPQGEVTRLLNGWAAGDDRSRDRLFELVHPEIRAIALRQRRGYGANTTLQATEIVHEAFLKLVDQPQTGWDHRAQFFKLASRVLRQVLVDHYRSRQSQKRGGDAERCEVPIDELPTPGGTVDLLDLDHALDRLAEIDGQAARIIDLRCFAGLTIPETANVLGTGTATVSRRWQVALAWLRRELDSDSAEIADPAPETPGA